jgi:hypothetical protein
MIQRTLRASAYRVAPQALALIVAALLGGACPAPPRKDSQAREGAQARVNELLAALRKADWSVELPDKL